MGVFIAVEQRAHTGLTTVCPCVFYAPGVFLNSGSIVIQAITGKKTMGTVSPGNNSGKGVDNGSVMAIGIMTQANDPTLYTKLKMTGPLVLKSVVSSQYKNPAMNEIARFALVRLPTFMIFE